MPAFLVLLFLSAATATRYRVDVYTSNVDHAGSHGDVYLSLVGTRGRSTEIKFDKFFKDDIERGNHDDYELEAEGLGTMKCVNLRTSSGDTWVPEKIVISDPEGNTWYFYNAEAVRFSNDQEDEGVEEAMLCEQGRDVDTLTIRVETEDRKWADSPDNGLRVVVYGSKARAGPGFLYTRGKKSFERGQVDEFVFPGMRMWTEWSG